MSVTASTSCEAYVMATLHALKHPTQPVMGFLLGKRPACWSSAENADDKPIGGKSSASSSSSPPTVSEDANEIFLSGAVPILHTGVPIAPSHILEVAYMQCSAIGHTKGLSVVGLYVANERMDDCSITDHVQGVIRFLFDKNQNGVVPSLDANLNSKRNSVVLWVANNKLVSATNCTEVAMQQYIFLKMEDTLQRSYKNQCHPLKFARWSTDKCGSEALDVSFPTKLFVAAVEDLLHETLCDMEEHLENPRLDYCNPGTAKRLVGKLRMMLK
eukprot:Tbor_TRINITY_DN5834_c2_g1::TRINITY_DN5834_c2_g1_i1::g.6632::m.6632